jgi:hypothetical protein
MTKHKKDRDLAIKIAISGNDEDVSNTGIQIVPDYLAREKRENLRLGLVSMVIKDWIAKFAKKRTEKELEIWRHDKWLSEINQRQTNRPPIKYPRDENDLGIITFPSKTREIV